MSNSYPPQQNSGKKHRNLAHTDGKRSPSFGEFIAVSIGTEHGMPTTHATACSHTYTGIEETLSRCGQRGGKMQRSFPKRRNKAKATEPTNKAAGTEAGRGAGLCFPCWRRAESGGAPGCPAPTAAGLLVHQQVTLKI